MELRKQRYEQNVIFRHTSVCAAAGQPTGMTKRNPGRILKNMQQRPFRGRGAVYCWLRENHQEVAEGFAATQAPWDTVVASMIRDGVTGQRGTVPNRKAAAKVWDRVCRDLQSEATKAIERKAAQAAAVQARCVQPSRLPATWKPTPVEPTPAHAMPRLAPATNIASALAAPIELSEAARARLAALDRRLEWRDRHVNPPKRKD